MPVPAYPADGNLDSSILRDLTPAQRAEWARTGVWPGDTAPPAAPEGDYLPIPDVPDSSFTRSLSPYQRAEWARTGRIPRAKEPPAAPPRPSTLGHVPAILDSSILKSWTPEQREEYFRTRANPTGPTQACSTCEGTGYVGSAHSTHQVQCAGCQGSGRMPVAATTPPPPPDPDAAPMVAEASPRMPYEVIERPVAYGGTLPMKRYHDIPRDSMSGGWGDVLTRDEIRVYQHVCFLRQELAAARQVGADAKEHRQVGADAKEHERTVAELAETKKVLFDLMQTHEAAAKELESLRADAAKRKSK